MNIPWTLFGLWTKPFFWPHHLTHQMSHQQHMQPSPPWSPHYHEESWAWLRKKNMCFKSHCWNDWVYLETTRCFRSPTFERDPNMNNGAIARYVINSIDYHLWVPIKASQLSKPYFLVSSVVGFPHDSLTNSILPTLVCPKNEECVSEVQLICYSCFIFHSHKQIIVYQ